MARTTEGLIPQTHSAENPATTAVLNNAVPRTTNSNLIKRKTPEALLAYLRDCVNNDLPVSLDSVIDVQLPSGQLRLMSKILKSHSSPVVRKLAHKMSRAARRIERSKARPVVKAADQGQLNDDTIAAALAKSLPSTAFVVSFSAGKPYPCPYSGDLVHESAFSHLLTDGVDQRFGFDQFTTFFDLIDRTNLADEHYTSTDDIEDCHESTPNCDAPVQVFVVLDGKTHCVDAETTLDVWRWLNDGPDPYDAFLVIDGKPLDLSPDGATFAAFKGGETITVQYRTRGGRVETMPFEPRCVLSQVPLEDLGLLDEESASDSDSDFESGPDAYGMPIFINFRGREAYTWVPERPGMFDIEDLFCTIYNVDPADLSNFYFTINGKPLRTALSEIRPDSTIRVSMRLRGGSMSYVTQTAPETTRLEFANVGKIEDLKTCVHAFADMIRDSAEYKPTRVDASSRLNANRAFITSLSPKQLTYNYTQYSQYKTQGDVVVARNVWYPNAIFNPVFNYTITLPHPSMAMEPLDITVWGSQVLEAATKEDMNVLTSALRTTNVRLSAQGIIAFTAYMKALMPESGRGAVFSATSVFLNALGYMLSLQSRASRGTPIGNENWRPDPGMPVNFDAGAWPYSSANTPGAPVVNTVALSLDTVINWLQFGTGNVPGTFDNTLIDSSCIIVPVNNDILSNPQLLAAWILIHMEYPFRTFGYTGTLFADNGGAYGMNSTAQSFHNLDRVPGVTDNVILVYTPGQATAGVQINVAGTVVPVAGDFAAPVDIGPALYAFMGLGNYLPFQTAFQTAMRMYGTGSAYDTALWRSALRHVRWKRPPTVNSDPANPLSGALVVFPNNPVINPPYAQGQANWVPVNPANIQAWYDSYTDPHLQIGARLAAVRSLSSPANYQIGLRSSALGLFVALGGAKVAGKAVWPLEANPVVIGERLYRVNQALTMRADLWCQANSITAQIVYNTGDQNPGVAGNYQTLIGPTSTALDGTTFSSLSDYLDVFTYMRTSVGEILYRTNAVTNAAYPYGSITPTSRCSILNAEGYANELISTDASTDFTSVAEANSICTADLGGNIFARYAPQIPMITGYKKALALRKSLFTGYWDETGHQILRWIPNSRAAAVTFVSLPTDMPGDGVGLLQTLAPFGTPSGRRPDFRELPHGCLQPNFRNSDCNALMIAAVNGEALFGQSTGRQIPNTAALDLVSSRYWMPNFAPITNNQERLTLNLFRSSGRDDSGGEKADGGVEGTATDAA